ncbi:MAG: response regulator [Sphingomonadales bacterium]|nr:response regulator [Sphingomonadales bacterium]
MSDDKKTKILLVDDDDLVRGVLSAMLEAGGYDVETASDGLEGLEMVEKVIPDLVITDVIMPFKEGIESIIEIKKLFPDMKIIAISGGDRFGKTSYLDIARKLGAAASLVKPFTRDVLLSTVEEVLAE